MTEAAVQYLHYTVFTCSPFMNHVSCAAGFDRPDVQFTLTVSPSWYRGLPPLMRGPSAGRAENIC